MHSTNEIVGLMFELNRVIKHRMMNREDQSDISMYQMHLLLALQEKPNLTMSEFAKMQHVSQATATSLVTRLQRLKLLTRKADRKNRKLVRLSLTEQGKKALHATLESCQKELKGVFSLIPLEDSEKFVQILQKLLTNLRTSVSSS